MVPVKRGERSKRSLPRAEFLGGIPLEAAHVRADHRHLVHRGRCEHRADTGAVLVPRGLVVAQPVPRLVSRATEARARDD